MPGVSAKDGPNAVLSPLISKSPLAVSETGAVKRLPVTA